MEQVRILKAEDCEVMTASWGSLTWFASGSLQNSEEVTVGRCIIRPGRENPRHYHPNCAEILVVVSGRILHEIEGGREVALGPGDTITLPPRLPHKARNITEEDAVLFIVFTSAERETVGE